MPAAPKNRESTNEQQEARKAREREIELRRLRGEISCAECRRLKLKCDKKVPCWSCVRRGCQTICPTGVLSAGQGTRFVLADTEKLHRKLSEMSNRIRQLEDALQIAHGGRSSSPHPLLADDLLDVKRCVDAADLHVEAGHEEDEVDGVIGSFGTLTVSEYGGMQFMGTTSSEMLLMSEVNPSGLFALDTRQPEPSLPTHPPEIADLAHAWPFAPLYLPKEDMQTLIEARLPPYERATALCEAYLENISWFFRPVDREQIMGELLPLHYKRHREGAFAPVPPAFSSSPREDGPDTHIDLHELALMLMVFACGAAGDSNLLPYNDEAETYHQLARAALSLKSVFDGASLSAVQAICMLGAYEIFAGRRNSLDMVWKLLTFGFSMSTSVGLHRDPARWNLDPNLVQRRRRLFWEIFCMDQWKSLGPGRPPFLNLEAIDTELAEDRDATVDREGNIVPSIWRWKHAWARDVLSRVSKVMSSAQPLKYSDILDLDKRVREFEILPAADACADYVTARPVVFLQRHATTLFKSAILIFIHRTFFARAMLDFPTNPLRSPFAPSFLCTYRSATTILKVIRENFTQLSRLLFRLWPIWVHSFAAAIIVGTVVVRSPNSTLAPEALLELELAITMFEKATVHTVVKHGMPILRRLREKAHQAIYEHRANLNSMSLPKTNPGPAVNAPPTLGIEAGDFGEGVLNRSGNARHIENQTYPGNSGSGSGSIPSSTKETAQSITSTPSQGQSIVTTQMSTVDANMSSTPLPVHPPSNTEFPPEVSNELNQPLKGNSHSAIGDLAMGSTVPPTPQFDAGDWDAQMRLLQPTTYGGQTGQSFPGSFDPQLWEILSRGMPSDSAVGPDSVLNTGLRSNGIGSAIPPFSGGQLAPSSADFAASIGSMPAFTPPAGGSVATTSYQASSVLQGDITLDSEKAADTWKSFVEESGFFDPSQLEDWNMYEWG